MTAAAHPKAWGAVSLSLRAPDLAEARALFKLERRHPEQIRTLDRNTTVALINARVFVGQWRVRGGERQLTWGRATANLPPSSADGRALAALPRGALVELDRKTQAVLLADKLMIGTWQVRGGTRRLVWAQAARLPAL